MKRWLRLLARAPVSPRQREGLARPRGQVVGEWGLLLDRARRAGDVREPLSGPKPFNEVMTDFDEFVARHVDELLRTAYLIVWDEGEGEDLVQECLLKVARRWPRIRRLEQPGAYARRILVNLALDGARGRARRRSELEPGVASTPIAVDPLPAVDMRAELLQALGQLPPRQRAVLVLRYFNDLTEAQVAEVLGCAPGTVKSSASRGLARLREALQQVPFQTRSAET